ncbi:MAG: NAD(P)-dependent alcohol dehydrogenase, partial [Phycisphaerae bacterium]
PMSDGSGVIGAVGQSVEGFAVGDRVVSHFITGWVDGPFRGDYAKTSLGTPGAGLAAQRVVLPATGVVPIPAGYDFSQAATLPIAALTAWSAMVTEGNLQPAGTVLTLGTGGVSVFALQIAKAMGARVIITSSRDDKLERARDLGADGTINYRADPQWHRKVLEFTEGQGVDVTVETGGAGTLDRSMLSTRPGGVISLLGVLAGVKAEVSTILMVMKRLHIAGIYVDSRSAFERMNRFLENHCIEPVIDRTFAFGDLPEALRYLESGSHFGKIVLTV